MASELPSSSKDLPWGHSFPIKGKLWVIKWYSMSITTATRQTVQFSAKVCPVEYELYGRYAHKRLSSPLSPPPPALWQHPPSCVACTPPGPFSGHSPPLRGLPVSYCPSQLYPLGPLLSQAHLLKELMSCQVFSKEAV